MTNQSRLRKIVWAIDPFDATPSAAASIVASLRRLSDTRASIEPVYVLTPRQTDLTLEFNGPWLKQLKPLTHRALCNYVEGVRLDGLLHPRVLVRNGFSASQAAQALAAYADRSGADLIVTGTHGRSGLARVAFGSFAESLLPRTKTSVLLLGPKAAVLKTKTILYPTDFTHSSSAKFRMLLALAKQFKSKIILFHALSHPIEPVIQSGVYLLSGAFISWPQYMTQEEQRRREIADRYAQIAKRAGVEMEVHFEVTQEGIATSIFKHAKRKGVSSIALSSSGSLAKQIIRNSHCPVWVL